MFQCLTLILPLAIAMSVAAVSQESDSRNKNLDIRSSAGDLHVGDDADAKKAGLPLYPGARISAEDEHNDKANLSVITEAFGMKLVVAKYDSDDAPANIVDFYRNKLRKYGKVLECHSQKHGGNIDVHEDNDSKDSKDLRCEEESGPVTELKVGTEENQHIVAVEPREKGKGTTFALVYVHTRGRRGEI